MRLVLVTEDQFESTGERSVRHLPTGGTYSTYNYDKLPSWVTVIGNNIRDRDISGNEYSTAEIENTARWLLIRKLSEAGIRP